MGPEEIWQLKVTLPPHTHLPSLNLSSAVTLQPLTWHTLFCFFPLSSPLLLLQILSSRSYFSAQVCRLALSVLRTLISLLLVSFSPLPLPHILQQQLNNELMFDNHCFCFSLTHTHKPSAACAGIAWSMFTLPLHSE